MLGDISTPIRKLLNCCLSYVTLAINAASAATFKTTGTTTYVIDGKALQKAALSAQAFTAGHKAQAPVTINGTTYGTSALYLVQLDAAGNVTTRQSNIAIAGVDADGKVNGTAMPTPYDQRAALPESDSNCAPIGFIKVTTNSSTTFTPGTTALDAAGLTVTYTNLVFDPATPFQ